MINSLGAISFLLLALYKSFGSACFYFMLTRPLNVGKVLLCGLLWVVVLLHPGTVSAQTATPIDSVFYPSVADSLPSYLPAAKLGYKPWYNRHNLLGLRLGLLVPALQYSARSLGAWESENMDANTGFAADIITQVRVKGPWQVRLALGYHGGFLNNQTLLKNSGSLVSFDSRGGGSHTALHLLAGPAYRIDINRFVGFNFYAMAGTSNHTFNLTSSTSTTSQSTTSTSVSLAYNVGADVVFAFGKLESTYLQLGLSVFGSNPRFDFYANQNTKYSVSKPVFMVGPTLGLGTFF